MEYDFIMTGKEGGYVGHQIAKDLKTAVLNTLKFVHHINIYEQESEVHIAELDEFTFEVEFYCWKYILKRSIHQPIIRG